MSRKVKQSEGMEISFIEPPEAGEGGIPEQKEHFQLPTRFGAVPVDEAPLGWEVETRRREVKVTKFQHAYPTIRLPFQEVHRVEFGHNDRFLAENEQSRKLKELFPTGANRLFFGDNLHIMRQLPGESIDLIYIDPPFFSGRNYNVIFGDKNEVRSFSDIWEGGMPGHLVWLNARLWEMKRLLKSTGSIYVHLDWHASHYVKVEMDNINEGAVVAWLKVCHDIHKFLLICPNTIVRDRLEDDFTDARVFRDFGFFPPGTEHYTNALGLHVMQPGEGPQGIRDRGVILGNIHQLYQANFRELQYMKRLERDKTVTERLSEDDAT